MSIFTKIKLNNGDFLQIELKELHNLHVDDLENVEIMYNCFIAFFSHLLFPY